MLIWLEKKNRVQMDTSEMQPRTGHVVLPVHISQRGLVSTVLNAVSVGTHCINLIESFPLFVRHPDSLSSLDRPPHVTRPDF